MLTGIFIELALSFKLIIFFLKASKYIVSNITKLDITMYCNKYCMNLSENRDQ